MRWLSWTLSDCAHWLLLSQSERIHANLDVEGGAIFGYVAVSFFADNLQYAMSGFDFRDRIPMSALLFAYVCFGHLCIGLSYV